MKHYKLTKNTKTEFGVKLFQIEATIDFKWAKKGELGGWIEKEENLEQDGDAWVYGNARVYGDARVSGDARVYGNAQVYGDAWVSGDARVYGNARVYGDARVSGDARVYGKLKLLAGYFFGIRYQKEEIKFVDIDEDYELIYRGEAKFGDNEDDEVAKAIKLLEEKGKLKDGKILI
jgi:hypothetical protein